MKTIATDSGIIIRIDRTDTRRFINDDAFRTDDDDDNDDDDNGSDIDDDE